MIVAESWSVWPAATGGPGVGLRFSTGLSVGACGSAWTGLRSTEEGLVSIERELRRAGGEMIFEDEP